MVKRRGGAEHTGLGAGTEVMDGQPTGNSDLDKRVNECAKDCYETFFKGSKLDYEVCDAGVEEDEIKLGIEPSYQSDPVKLIIINRDKNCSRFVTGIARGYWGSEWQSRMRHYDEYSRQSKFVKFIDKWHPILFNTERQKQGENNANNNS